MATLIVGDLHGKLEVVKQALATPHNVVFVGDYLDSYTESIDLQIQTLDTVLDAIENNGDRVQGLIGNHEMSYLEPGLGMRCSGFSPVTDMHVMTRFSRMYHKLKCYTWVDNFLISHAGVSQWLLNNKGYSSVHEYLDDGNYYQIGVNRGGTSPVGGLFWCDWRFEFEPIADVPQIVGHTRGSHIRRMGNSYCIDVLDSNNPRCLLIDDGEVAVWNLEKSQVDEEYSITVNTGL